MSEPHKRLAVAGSLALAMSFAVGPAAMAQDDPSATVREFIDAVVAKDLESLASYFCEEQAGQAAQFDVSAMTAVLPPGVDAESILDAFVFDIQVDTLDTVNQSDDEAVVHFVGSISLDIEPEPLIPVVEAIVEMAGMEADEATVEMFLGILMAEFESMSEEVDLDVTLVPGEERPWLICSDLDFGSADGMDDGIEDDGTVDASAEPSDDAGDDSY